jgi:hypothetical protein
MKSGRKHRETGGANEAEEDLETKPEPRTNAKNIDEEAEEKKKGGRVKKRHGGKMVGKVDGEKPMHHAGRKPRKSGGRATSDANPFTSARSGKDAPGRNVMKGEAGFGED